MRKIKGFSLLEFVIGINLIILIFLQVYNFKGKINNVIKYEKDKIQLIYEKDLVRNYFENQLGSNTSILFFKSLNNSNGKFFHFENKYIDFDDFPKTGYKYKVESKEFYYFKNTKIVKLKSHKYDFYSNGSKMANKEKSPREPIFKYVKNFEIKRIENNLEFNVLLQKDKVELNEKFLIRNLNFS